MRTIRDLGMNILIHKSYRELDDDPLVSVRVRQNYSPIDHPDYCRHIDGDRRFDLAARNRIGGMGASVLTVRAELIEAAVAELRAAFGCDLPVYNNVHVGYFDRPINISGEFEQ